jgi:hypothetical protein
MPRLVRPALAVLVAAAAAALLALGTGSGHAQAPAGERTLQFTSTLGGLRFVDAPPRGRAGVVSRGDLVAFTNVVSDTAGARAGTLHAVCHVTAPRRSITTAIFQCSGTTLLRDGTLALGGAVPIGADGPVTLAVTGGTGAYEGVRGSVLSVPRGSGDVADDTVHLLG